METVEILLRFVSGQLSLLPSAERKMSTGQSAVTLCGWGVKAGMVHSTCGQTCRWQLGGELLMIKRYTNRHFTLLTAALIKHLHTTLKHETKPTLVTGGVKSSHKGYPRRQRQRELPERHVPRRSPVRQNVARSAAMRRTTTDDYDERQQR